MRTVGLQVDIADCSSSDDLDFLALDVSAGEIGDSSGYGLNADNASAFSEKLSKAAWSLPRTWTLRASVLSGPWAGLSPYLVKAGRLFIYRRLLEIQDEVAVKYTAPQPIKHPVITCAVKFDETSQNVLWREKGGAAMDTEAELTPLHVPVMVCRMFLDIPGSMAFPFLYMCQLLVLETQKTPGLFAGLSRHLHFDSRSDMSQVAHWSVLMFMCDSASSNVRLCAWQVQAKAIRSLVYCIFCLMHSIHNSVAPVARRLSIVSELYRASRLFRLNSFFKAE